MEYKDILQYAIDNGLSISESKEELRLKELKTRRTTKEYKVDKETKST